MLAAAIIEQLAAAGIAKIGPNWNPQVADELAARYETQWDRQRMARELLRLTALLVSLKQDVMAIEQLQMALDLAGESTEIADAAGKQLDQVAGGRVTLKVLQQFVTSHPKSASAHCQFGIALLKRRKITAALSAFDAALAIDPDSQQALHFAGLIDADSGNLPQAEAHFRRLIAVAPQLASAHQNLANVLVKQGQHDEANEQRKIAETLQSPSTGGQHVEQGTPSPSRAELPNPAAELLANRPTWRRINQSIDLLRRRRNSSAA